MEQKQDIISKNKTCIIYDKDKTKQHQSVKKHVENPERIEKIIENLKEKQLIDQCSYVQDNIKEPIKKEQILQAHNEDYYNFIEGMWPEEMERPQIMVKDCYINQNTFQAALLSAGGVLQACAKVCSGQADNAFAIVRPPGHHSGASPVCHGFCFLSNVAIAAKEMQKQFGLKKILIFDWDIHHGDGTSKIFHNDPSVLFISIHRYDNGLYFPKTGDPKDIGSGDGKGYNINVGWNLRENLNPSNQEYIYLFERICLPIIKEFQPELILVSSGFDAFLGDPVGKCSLTELGYCYMLQKLMEVQKKVVLALEGGYDFQALQLGSEAVVRVLLGQKMPIPEITSLKLGVDIEYHRKECLPNSLAIESSQEILKYIKGYWPVLNSKEIIEYEEQIVKNYHKTKNLAGGHKNQIEFEDDRFLKACKSGEINFYNSLDDKQNEYFEENQKMKKFIPKFYGVVEKNDKKYINIENMIYGKENGSTIDLKLGKITAHISSSKEKLDRDYIKSQQSTSGELHFKVTGCNIKNKHGDIIEKFDPQTSPKNKLNEIFQKLMKSNGEEKVNQKSLEKIIDYLQEFLQFYENQNTREFVATSIFIVVDNTTDQCEIKAIDFNYVDPIQDELKKDMNVIPGIKNILKYFKDLN